MFRQNLVAMFIMAVLPAVAFISVSLAGEILIMDNSDVSGVEITGVWKTSTYSKGQYHGSNYIHDDNREKGAKSVRFYPSKKTGFVSGKYTVYITYSSHSNRATNMPVRVNHANGLNTNTVNQKSSGGKWHLLGDYYFKGDGTGYVEIGTDKTDGYVVVDAIKFVKSS